MPLIGNVSNPKGGLPGKKIGAIEQAGSGLGQLATVPVGHVRFMSDELGSFLDVLLNTAGGQVTGGGPRHDISERAGRVGVAEYKGHDPLRLSVSIILDGYQAGESIEPELRKLRAMSERLPNRVRMPVIKLQGPVPYTDRKWLVDGPWDWDDTPTPIQRQVLSSAVPVRQALTINLIEKVPDRLLRESISESRGTGKGSKARTIRVQAGDDNFGDVSKRHYGTRARAVDIARANSLPFGFRLKKGQKLRLPQ